MEAKPLDPETTEAVLAPVLVRAQAQELQAQVEFIAAKEQLAAAKRTVARVRALLPVAAPEEA